MSAASASALVNPEQETVEASLRRVLFKMAAKLDDAHAGARAGIEHHMAMAQFYARITLPGMMGVWGVNGPLAGLSMLSGLLNATDLATACDHVQELAELSWRAQSLNADLSPYGDDFTGREFVGTFHLVQAKVKESGGR